MVGRPEATVVVPTYNRRTRLERVLRALAAQDTQEPFEVVVVSDGSTDGTDEYLTSGRTPLPVVAALQPNRGPAAARNHGVERATADLVVFLDDDVVPAPELVGAHLAAHRRAGDDGAVVIGPMLNPPDHRMSPWVRWEQAMLAKQYAAMERGDWDATERQFYTGNASLHRRHLDAVGGFDTAFLRAEDVELAYRLADRGLRFAFEPAAIGLHYAERSFESWKGVARAYGRHAVEVSRERGRDEVLELVAKEFGERNAWMRRFTRLCVDRPRISAVAETGLRGVAVVADRVGAHSIGQFALSGVYSVAYYQGIADELGGGAALWSFLADPQDRFPRKMNERS